MRVLKWVVIGLAILLVITAAALEFIVAPMVEKGLNKTVAHETYPVSQEAKQLHSTLIVGDWHTDSLLWDRNLLDRADYGHVDFPRLQEGNVALQMFTAVTKSPKGQNYESNEADAPDNITLLSLVQMWPFSTWSNLNARAVYQAERLHTFESSSPETVKIVKTVQDLNNVLEQRSQGQKITGALLGVEGAHSLDGKLEHMTTLYEAGYRMVGLHHFFDNKLGGSLHGTSKAGLSEFGRNVVKKANEMNMLIDVAHSSPEVVADVLAMSTAPVVISHTGIHSHHEAHRNISDELMVGIASMGGVIAIGYWDDVVGKATPKGVVAAIRAAINLVGEDHVSLGSDYDGSIEAYFDTSELAALTHEMLLADFTETEIRKVMGENMVRLLRETLPK